MSLIYLLNKKDIVTIDDSYKSIVILSPSLYWFKTCDIPTKNKAKAKKIASHMMTDRPKLFNEVFVFKTKELYHAYAYDKEALNEILKNLNIENYEVYFANQLNIDQTIRLDDKHLLSKYKSSLLELQNTKNSDNYPSIKDNYIKLLENEKSFISSKNDEVKSSLIFKITTLLFLSYMVLYGISKSKIIQTIDQNIASLNKENISMYQIDSLITKYKK